MANNRLYIYNPASKSAFLLAKSMGDGWYVHIPETFGERFNAWLEENSIDDPASYGVINESKTQFILLTENEPLHSVVCKEGEVIVKQDKDRS